jgi:hypothetical protein
MMDTPGAWTIILEGGTFEEPQESRDFDGRIGIEKDLGGEDKSCQTVERSTREMAPREILEEKKNKRVRKRRATRRSSRRVGGAYIIMGSVRKTKRGINITSASYTL